MGKAEFISNHGEDAYKVLVGKKATIRGATDAIDGDILIILGLIGFRNKGMCEASKAIASHIPADCVEEAQGRARATGYPVELHPANPIFETRVVAEDEKALIADFPSIQAASKTEQVYVCKPKETEPAA